MSADAALLAEVPFFQLLDASERELLAGHLEHVRLPTGQMVCEYGDALRRAGHGEEARGALAGAAARARVTGDTDVLIRAAAVVLAVSLSPAVAWAAEPKNVLFSVAASVLAPPTPVRATDGKRHLVIHGHQFDRFVSKNLVLSGMGTLLHLYLQKLDFKGKYFSRLADRLNTRWLRLSHKVASGAILHARFKQADRVFCGHTHLAMQSTRDGVEYYNSGSWTDKSATYVTVSEEGVRIHEFGQRPDHRDSGEERGAADTQAAGSALSAGLPANREYASAGR